MIGHLPLAVYAVMLVCAYVGLVRRKQADRTDARIPGTIVIGLALGAIFLVRLSLAGWFDPGRDGDIAWQQWLGLQIIHTGHLPSALGAEAFTAPGAPWVPQEWALSVLVALTLGTPFFIVTVLVAATMVLITLLVTAMAARALEASTVAIAFAVVCVGFAMLESYGIRAQVFGWAVLALLFFLLRTSTGPRLWLAVPLVAVWANLHASAALAPVLLALWTIGMAIDEGGWTPNVRQCLFVTLGCVAAVFITPLGYRLPLYALHLVASPIRAAINEWQPSDITATSFSLGALPLIVATCIFGVEPSRRWRELLLFAAMTWLTFSAVRNVPIAAIALAPAVAQRLTAYLAQSARVNSIFSERPIRMLFYAGCGVAAILAGAILFTSTDYTKGTLPVAAIASLGAIPGTHNLYCEDFAWCSLALQYPNVREFLDGRADPFPPPVWKDYETVYAAKGAWRQVLRRRDVNAIVIEKQHALASALPEWRAWRLVYEDKKFRLFLRN
ncbi:MAG TPA: hypothetical protein VFE17_01955 [Candidatus Baltobacteraceae bacterium]|jgi:hypothetical protein|nr:hypothetical protein [Candidatus Baltobacteraceae bacterium]